MRLLISIRIFIQLLLALVVTPFFYGAFRLNDWLYGRGYLRKLWVSDDLCCQDPYPDDMNISYGRWRYYGFLAKRLLWYI